MLSERTSANRNETDPASKRGRLESIKVCWRHLAPLVFLLIFVVMKLAHPMATDKVLDDLSGRWVSWFIAHYYAFDLLQEPVEPQVVVGLFDEPFARSSKERAPTAQDYTTIINRLVTLGAKEVVIDMRLRFQAFAQDNRGPISANASASNTYDDLKHAFSNARDKQIPIILPFRSIDDVWCPDDETRSGAAPVPVTKCKSEALGAVRFFADDPTTYYPLWVRTRLDKDKYTFVPSLAWAAYLALQGHLADGRQPLDPDWDQLYNDMFPVWRKPMGNDQYVYCHFSVTRLLSASLADAGVQRCEAAEGSEAKGDIGIGELIKDKVVLIGQADDDSQDWVDSPFRIKQPGVMLHATALDNLIRFDGKYLINRDDVWRSFGRFDLPFSWLYVIMCLLTPPLIELAALGVMIICQSKKIGLLGRYSRLSGAVVCAPGMIPALSGPVIGGHLAPLNAAVVFFSAYGLLAIDRWVESQVEFREKYERTEHDEKERHGDIIDDDTKSASVRR